MSKLSQIAVRVEAPMRSGGLGGGVAAVLSELIGMLEEASLGSKASAIDLRSLPMSVEDRIELQATLGQGEVHASLSARGISTFRETAISGVWWIEHRDEAGDLVAELIEVCAFPQILAASNEEISAGVSALRDRLPVASTASVNLSHATHR